MEETTKKKDFTALREGFRKKITAFIEKAQEIIRKIVSFIQSFVNGKFYVSRNVMNAYQAAWNAAIKYEQPLNQAAGDPKKYTGLDTKDYNKEALDNAITVLKEQTAKFSERLENNKDAAEKEFTAVDRGSFQGGVNKLNKQLATIRRGINTVEDENSKNYYQDCMWLTQKQIMILNIILKSGRRSMPQQGNVVEKVRYGNPEEKK